MKLGAFSLLAVGASCLSSCANVGPDAVGACLNDDRVMNMYRSAKEPSSWYIKKGLVGGIDRQSGQITCHWGETNLASDIITPLPTGPFPSCLIGSKDCTFLMDGDNVIFKPRSTVQQELNAIWYLTGALAVGIAQGYASAQANAPITTYNRPVSAQPLDCQPTGVKGIGGAPTYRCK